MSTFQIYPRSDPRACAIIRACRFLSGSHSSVASGLRRDGQKSPCAEGPRANSSMYPLLRMKTGGGRALSSSCPLIHVPHQFFFDIMARPAAVRSGTRSKLGAIWEQGLPMKRSAAFIIAIVLALGASVPATAGPFEEGNAAYLRGDYSAALKLYGLAANQGAAAQNRLGYMYFWGDGAPQDMVKGVALIRLAALQGNANAQNNLGHKYYDGRGVLTCH